MSSGDLLTGSSPPGAQTPRWRRVVTVPLLGCSLWLWFVGLAISLVLLGPALGQGSLLNLDLVTAPELPVPRGVWGLGPELPRRVPLGLISAWLSPLIGGDAAVKLLMVVGLVLAFAGMARLVGRNGLVALAAAMLYAFGPFLLTRVAVGHLMILWTMAFLPWALPDLLEPDRSLRRDLWWAATIGVAGIYGGMIVGFVLVAGLAARRGRRWAGVLLVYLIGQLPWLVPVLVVGGTGTIADGSSFTTIAPGLSGMGRLLAGHGFWNGYFQIGKSQGWVAGGLGFLLLALAAYGTKELPRPWRSPLVGLAVLGLVLATLMTIPGLDDVWTSFTGTLVGAPFREAQRFLVLYLVWLAPAAALGASRLSRNRGGALGGVVLVAPLAIAVILASPASWGFNDQLRPAQFPSEWAAARAAVRADPGTMVAFPWYQYFTLDLAENRLVLNVVPFYFGGDVLISSDPNVTVDARRERGDPREPSVAGIAAEATHSEPVSADLAALGVRWVVLQHDVDWERYTGVTDDPGLERIVSGSTLDLYRVREMSGTVVTDEGSVVPFEPVIAPFGRLAASGAALVGAPYQPGWLRGLQAVSEGHDGLVAVPEGSGPLWFWPTIVVAVADALTLGTLAVAEVTNRRRSRRVAADPDCLHFG